MLGAPPAVLGGAGVACRAGTGGAEELGMRPRRVGSSGVMDVARPESRRRERESVDCERGSRIEGAFLERAVCGREKLVSTEDLRGVSIRSGAAGDMIVPPMAGFGRVAFG